MTPPLRAGAIAAALLAAALGAGPSAAGALSDFVFAPGAFQPGPGEAPPAWPLAYRHDRLGPRGATAVTDTVALAPGSDDTAGRLVLTRTPPGEAPRPLANFSPEAANPVLLYFLESVARHMAEATGGSPFYIRNRIREAVAAAGLGGEAEGSEVRSSRIEPFAADRNRARMGDFADLVLTIEVAPRAPGRIIALSADTAVAGEGYHESLTLIAETH